MNKVVSRGLIFNDRYNKIFDAMQNCSESLKADIKNWFGLFESQFTEDFLAQIEEACNNQKDVGFTLYTLTESLEIYLDFNRDEPDELFAQFNITNNDDGQMRALWVDIFPYASEYTYGLVVDGVEGLKNLKLTGEQGSVRFKTIKADSCCGDKYIEYDFDLVLRKGEGKHGLGCRKFEGEEFNNSLIETSFGEVTNNLFLINDGLADTM